MCADGYLCRDGTKLIDDGYCELNYGQFVNDDKGFIIKSKGVVLNIQRYTYGLANTLQYLVRIVEYAGIFDENRINFLNGNI